MVFLLGPLRRALGQARSRVAAALLEPSPTRPPDLRRASAHRHRGAARRARSRALAATIAAEPVEAKLKDARRHGRFDPKTSPPAMWTDLARGLHAGVIDEREFAGRAPQSTRNKVIRVDDFPYDLDLWCCRRPGHARTFAGAAGERMNATVRQPGRSARIPREGGESGARRSTSSITHVRPS